MFIIGVRQFSNTYWLQSKWQGYDITSSLVFILLLTIDFRYLITSVFCAFGEGIESLKKLKRDDKARFRRFRRFERTSSILELVRYFGLDFLRTGFLLTFFQYFCFIRILWNAFFSNWNWIKICLAIVFACFDNYLNTSNLDESAFPTTHTNITLGIDKFVYVLLPHLFAFCYMERTYYEWRYMQYALKYELRMEGINGRVRRSDTSVDCGPGLFSQLVLNPTFYTRVLIAHHQIWNNLLQLYFWNFDLSLIYRDTQAWW